jgi:predicted phosphodiesterase
VRLAILADIHGNLAAFQAALDHLATQHVDQIVIAGDVVNGAPDSRECWLLARSLNCPILRGNHERYVAHYGTPRADPVWTTGQFAPLQWTLSQFSDQERAEMADLPLTLHLEDAPDLLLVHGSARNDNDTITAHTPEPDLDAMFEGTTERYIVRAHNHVGRVRLWGDRFIITNGSAGWPLDGFPTSQYLVMEQRRSGWHITQHSVPYDLDATIRRFEDSGYLQIAGPIGVLFLREVATASQQIVPFLRAYSRWSAHSSITLQAALDRFLTRGY